MTPSAIDKRSHRSILTVVLLAQFVTPLVLFSLGALAPLLRVTLPLSREQLGVVTNSVWRRGRCVYMPSRWLADRLGVRYLLIGPQLLSGLALMTLLGWSTYHALILTGHVLRWDDPWRGDGVNNQSTCRLVSP